MVSHRYVFVARCPYVVLSDSVNHFAMIWGKPSGWPRNFLDIAESYGGTQHQDGRIHHCKLIRAANHSQNKEHPRHTFLAFLCYLALLDHGVISP